MKKTLSIVIPVYNEQSRIGMCLRALRTYTPPREITIDRVIFVDDGSTDKTVKILKHATIPYTKTIISYAKNRGKGFAVKTGVANALGDYILVLDADMSTQLTELNKFIPAMKKNIDVIIGTRKNGHSTVVTHQPMYRELFGRGFTRLSNIMLNTWVTDFTCGFKAYKQETARMIFSHTQVNDWGFDAESLFLAKKFDLTIKEIAVMWSDKKGSKVRILRDIPVSLFNLVSIRIRDVLNVYSQVVKPTLAKAL